MPSIRRDLRIIYWFILNDMKRLEVIISKETMRKIADGKIQAILIQGWVQLEQEIHFLEDPTDAFTLFLPVKISQIYYDFHTKVNISVPLAYDLGCTHGELQEIYKNTCKKLNLVYFTRL